MLDLRTAILLALGCGACLSAEAQFSVYDEHEFLVGLPGLKAVTSLAVRPAGEGAPTGEAGETRYIVNGDGVRVWGGGYRLVKGSQVAYTIKYVDGGGENEVTGTYTFDGDYHQNPYSNDDPNAGSTNQVSKDDAQEEGDDEEDEDDEGPQLESRFGGFGHRHRGRHHLRRPRPPFGFPRGPGMPHYPHMGGPERFPPPHRPPFPRHDDRYCPESGEGHNHGRQSGERHPHRGGSGERYPYGEESGERYPHGGRATAHPTPRPRAETTTAYTPEIDIRFQDD